MENHENISYLKHYLSAAMDVKLPEMVLNTIKDMYYDIQLVITFSIISKYENFESEFRSDLTICSIFPFLPAYISLMVRDTQVLIIF